MADVNKKELLTVCFSCCRGLWMYLDQQSFTRIHLLLQRLRNLLSLMRWGRSQQNSADHWTVVEEGCWNRERWALKQHIWLGQLVQWFSITGLLPKAPDSRETKHIAQMWREMEQSQRLWCESLGREDSKDRTSLIQSMVAQVNKQHGPVWTSEDSPQQGYPPPCLQALLKLVLVPHIDTVSLQAILMYFVQDVTNFLQCKDDLLKSFALAFTIPLSFCQQIKGFWLLDHGQISRSMDLLLSCRSAHPYFSWHHRSIVQTLLRRGEACNALRYIYRNRPPVENVQDHRLYVDVLLQNRCITEAWALLKESKAGNDDTIRHYLLGCERLGLSVYSDINLTTPDKVKSTSSQTEGPIAQSDVVLGQSGETQLQADTSARKEPICAVTGLPPRPLSARLFQAQSCAALSSADLVAMLREAVQEVMESPPPARRSWEAVWPSHQEKALVAPTPCLSLHTRRHVLPSPPPALMDNGHMLQPSEKEESEEEEEEEPAPDMEQLVEYHTHSVSQDSCSEESVSSFTTASTSPSPFRQDVQPEVGSSWVQQPDLPTRLSDGECLDGPEENSGYGSEPCMEDTALGCPDLMLTLEGATRPVTVNSLSKENVEDVGFSAPLVMEESRTCATAGDNFLTAEGASGFTVDVTCAADTRGNRSKLNLPPQFFSNEDNQSAPSAPYSLMESDNFLSPDYDKMDYTKAVPEDMYPAPHVITGAVRSGSRPEEKAKKFFSQDSVPTSTSGSHFFLDLEPLQRASDPVKLEEGVECFRMQGLPGGESRQDYAADGEGVQEAGISRSRLSLLDLEMSQKTGGRYKKPFSLQGSPLLIPIRRPERPRQLHGSGAPPSVRRSPARSPQVSSSEPARDKTPSGRTSPKKEAACFRSTSDRLGHCKLGSWWKQALETRRASTGLLPAIDQISSISPAEAACPALRGRRAPCRCPLPGLIRHKAGQLCQGPGVPISEQGGALAAGGPALITAVTGSLIGGAVPVPTSCRDWQRADGVHIGSLGVAWLPPPAGAPREAGGRGETVAGAVALHYITRFTRAPDKNTTHCTGRPYSPSFPGSLPKQKGDRREGKEVGKDESARRGSYKLLHRGSLGPQRGSAVKRGKRVKRA
ncbi:hypothetical protein MATL_G00163500 [Megalops atlanticus]|uniref:ELYS-like domain-containing protein n=1 Tax=Megalops atlanticus TaxID=7932 RepID=A0A9D3T875_MEGAT|nr:hypothetical protein MATL_G00163500 [Megalops atlanticus]